jgi:hypothetical protein
MNAENPVQIDLFGVSATRTKDTRLAEHIRRISRSRLRLPGTFRDDLAAADRLEPEVDRQLSVTACTASVLASRIPTGEHLARLLMIIRNAASKIALLISKNVAGQRRVVAHDRPDPTDR